MTTDSDNLVDLDARRASANKVLQADMIDALRFAQMQRDFFELQVLHLRRVARAMLILAFTAYVLGTFCGFFVGRHV